MLYLNQLQVPKKTPQIVTPSVIIKDLNMILFKESGWIWTKLKIPTHDFSVFSYYKNGADILQRRLVGSDSFNMVYYDTPSIAFSRTDHQNSNSNEIR